MSFVTASPDLVSAAAGQLAGIRSSLGAAVETAAGPTTGIATAAADEISLAISRVFGTYGQEFQALNAQAASFNAEFVRLLNGGATAYLEAEIANAQRTLAGAGVAAPAATDPFGGLLGPLGPILGGGTSGGGTTTGGGGGLLGGLLGPLSGGTSGLSTLISGAGLSPLFNNAGQQLGSLISGFANGTGGAALTNALQGFTGPIGTIPIVGDLGRVLFPGLFAPAVVTAPTPPMGSAWQQLFTNTSNNLSALGYAMNQDPFPLLRQIAANQQGYAAQINSDIAYIAANPAVWAEANLRYLATANPALAIQTVLTDQVKYANILGTSLARFGADVQAGLGQFQTSWQAVNHDIAIGDYNGAVEDGTAAFLNLFITGFDTSNLNDIKIVGPASDLFPIFALPGQEAQTFANLFPGNSVPGKMTQNFANILNAFADTSVSTTIGFELQPTPRLSLDANFGLPMSVLFSVLGAPVAGLDGFATASSVIGNGIATGNIGAIAAGIVDSPAYVLDGMLNGTTIVDLTMGVKLSSVPVLGPVIDPLLGDVSIPIEMHLPFNGLLVPPQQVTATVPLNLFNIIDIPINLTLGGTPFAGLANTLLVYTPRHLADVITPV
ncbi:PE-PGRS family protein [Mycobacterium asiaticum]|uniref:PE-PGRS family protein n=1 Tax=Mycobacterium asiaticum TaxID=1790 RepID=A0A1A3P4F2_MYCAS|nr:PE family protein [Mycobacterium asiaticum]OBK28545.1 PE-PGRS family protein [Mycobacterium asiaticum]